MWVYVNLWLRRIWIFLWLSFSNILSMCFTMLIFLPFACLCCFQFPLGSNGYLHFSICCFLFCYPCVFSYLRLRGFKTRALVCLVSSLVKWLPVHHSAAWVLFRNTQFKLCSSLALYYTQKYTYLSVPIILGPFLISFSSSSNTYIIRYASLLAILGTTTLNVVLGLHTPKFLYLGPC